MIHLDSTSNDYYNTIQWRNLRNFYIQNNPLCERCMKQGLIERATEVHHIKPFSKGKTINEKVKLLLDEDNLMSVCNKCHKLLHSKALEIKSKGILL